MDAVISRLSDFPVEWDGKAAVQEMMAANYNWRQSEWPGFFFQLLCRRFLSDIMEIPGRRYDTGDFDGFLFNDWDFKTHTGSIAGVPKRSSEVILNDLETINQALARHGKIHFLVATGDAEMDTDGSFKSWHDHLKGIPSAYVLDRAARGARSRMLKTHFRIESIEIVEINQKNCGLMKTFAQGRNSNGMPRPMKYSLGLDRIPESDRVRVG